MRKQISFCISCKNRLHQIEKTLVANLQDNRKNKETTEFVLVDLGSTDGLGDWVLANFGQELAEGYLKYLFTTQIPDWHASIAKNTAHYHSTGTFLVNLDADNFTGENGSKYVYDKFIQYGPKILLHQFSGEWRAGTYGRIGMHRKYFFAIGGYDESFEPMGHQDVDLINRLEQFGLSYKRFPDLAFNRSIPNDKSESIRYSNSLLSWNQMESTNGKRSIRHIYAGRLTANEGLFGIRKDIWMYKDGKMVPC